MGRTAFVTGSTGFLGQHLVAALRGQGWRVVGLHVAQADPAPIARLGAWPALGELNDPASLERAIPADVDVVFHLAANTSAWSRNDAQQDRDNIDGTRRVIEAALRARARRLVYTSSISAFGHHPGVRIDESTPSNALDCGMNYHRTKLLAERLVKAAAGRGLPGVILNPCNVIGPGDTRNWTRQYILPACKGTLAGIPPGVATWCHVHDVVQAHLAAVDRGEAGENYLLGGTEASFLELVNTIEAMLEKPPSRRVLSRSTLRVACSLMAIRSWLDGREPPLTIEKYRRAVGTIVCDCSKARRVLGYATRSLPDMLGDTIAWLRAGGML